MLFQNLDECLYFIIGVEFLANYEVIIAVADNFHSVTGTEYVHLYVIVIRTIPTVPPVSERTYTKSVRYPHT